MKPWHARTTDRRGAALVLLAISMAAMLSVAALAVDIGILLDARSDAQRAADSAALAGASSFQVYSGTAAIPEARNRALALAGSNNIRGVPINASGAPAGNTSTTVYTANEVTVTVLTAQNKVRVRVRRAAVGTYFARIFGIQSMPVTASAAAWASTGSQSVSCLKPFLIPDMWSESSRGPGGEDANSNSIIDGTEQWNYVPAANGDRYAAYDPKVISPPLPQTGYGSAYRAAAGFPGDTGLPLLLKPQTGNSQRHGNWYFILDGPLNNLRDNITTGCINAAAGDTPVLATGGKTGQAKQGIGELVADDPGATWNQSTKRVDNSKYGNDWAQSKRVILVGLFDPIYIQGTGKNDKPDPGVKYTNFGRIFLENVSGNSDITARFIGFGPGGTGGTNTASLTLKLQLVE